MTTHSTTVLLVRRDGRVCMAADGQVTMNNQIVKAGANKVKRAGKGKVLDVLRIGPRGSIYE